MDLHTRTKNTFSGSAGELHIKKTPTMTATSTKMMITTMTTTLKKSKKTIQKLSTVRNNQKTIQ